VELNENRWDTAAPFFNSIARKGVFKSLLYGEKISTYGPRHHLDQHNKSLELSAYGSLDSIGFSLYELEVCF
jgi:hypothetical protein